MGKIFLTIVVLYALFVAICLLRLKLLKRRKKDVVGKGNTIPETGNLKTDIVGKSKYEKSATTPLISKSTPLATTSSENEKRIENPDTFVAPNEAKPSVKVPEEELDEVFSDTPSEDENKPMDIDYPLEYESDEASETGNEEEEEEEIEEVDGASQASLATGVAFEDLGNAVRAVNRAKETTPDEKKAAGNTLLEIRKTDMFEQLVSKPDARETVTSLMTKSLADFHRRKDKEAGNTGSGRKAPDSFDIRDFA